MKLLKRYENGWYILCFRLGRFGFSWFTDCGEWFIYLRWYGRKSNRYIRFSSAICDCGKYDRRVKDENA